ncbi:HD-GYP domain-containing protein [Deinococcus budaensis]|uniref:Phosphohydrolase n=1 Tax=Deinococcus budaensis TaxID=1665626 RepID=A0A7W8GCJ6_9DEIO|nr:HD-GYP domain-containing protein [Deinococcus budaensis]MBB5233055.1 hypothetical protein [Deinococcus budaensis]
MRVLLPEQPGERGAASGEELLAELTRVPGPRAGRPGLAFPPICCPCGLRRGAGAPDAANGVDAAVQLLGAFPEGSGPEGWQGGHLRRIVAWAEALTVVAGLAPDEVQAVRWGAALHDIGKARVPRAILQKPGPLDAHEFAVILRHPEWGVELLGRLPSLPAQTLDAVRHHHERWDGGGYPAGLRRCRIPLSARIVALADVYDALTSERPYKAAWSEADAARYLLREAGRQFDPHLAPLFVREVLGFRDLLASGPC